MLKARILTAFPLVIGILWLVWAAPAALSEAAFLVLTLLGAWEWAALSGWQARYQRVLFSAIIAGLLILALLLGLADYSVWRLPALFWWFGIFLLLIAQARRKTALALPSWLLLSAGVVTLTLAWLGLMAIYRGENGAFWLTSLFVLVWGSDIGGFFIGQRFGRRALATQLSPAKTWEGVLGGMILGLVLITALVSVGRLFDQPTPALGWLWPVAVMVILSAVVGDLAESFLKRHAGAKDSGYLLPGHGGILDRVDALLAAAPVMAAALMGLV
jgi:phosphatidate cytidylyltransferase